MHKLINEFKEIHGGKYDYSLVEFKNMNTKVKIKCNKHNIIFEQTPVVHIKNKTEGCSFCFDENLIERFKETHGDKYDYSLVEYKNNKSKVKIICKQHDVFEQTPDSHKTGIGCPKCSVLSQEEIMTLFQQVHGDRYDYSLVEYTSTQNKIKIICPKHGVFEQTPSNHKTGRGCSHCASELTAKEMYQNQPTILYYILINNSQYKVGITKTSINKRYQKELKEGIDIKIIKEIDFQDGYQAFLLEQEILNKSKDRGTLLKEDCIIDGGYSEIRTSSFIDVFDENVNNFSINKLK